MAVTGMMFCEEALFLLPVLGWQVVCLLRVMLGFLLPKVGAGDSGDFHRWERLINGNTIGVIGLCHQLPVKNSGFRH